MTPNESLHPFDRRRERLREQPQKRMERLFGRSADHLNRSQDELQRLAADKVLQQQRERAAFERSLWLPQPPPITPRSLGGRL